MRGGSASKNAGLLGGDRDITGGSTRWTVRSLLENTANGSEAGKGDEIGRISVEVAEKDDKRNV